MSGRPRKARPQRKKGRKGANQARVVGVDEVITSRQPSTEWLKGGMLHYMDYSEKGNR